MDQPLHALLCPVGSTGDLHPLLAVGTAMRARGHRVTVIGGEPFAPAVARAGFEFVAVQSAAVEQAALAHKDAWSYADGYRVHMPLRCLEPLRRTHQAIVERYEPGRTVVAALNWCLAARVAQESHGVPTATFHLNAFTLRSARGILKMPAPMLVAPWIFPWFVRFEFRVLDALFVDPVCRPTLNAFRGELGLPPVRRVMDSWYNSPDAVVGMFPDWWCAPPPNSESPECASEAESQNPVAPFLVTTLHPRGFRSPFNLSLDSEQSLHPSSSSTGAWSDNASYPTWGPPSCWHRQQRLTQRRPRPRRL